MDRTETAGLGLAVLAHVGLLALLSLTLLSRQVPPKPVSTPIEVSFAPDMSLQASAPKPIEPPAPSQAPDQGVPEDAAPPPTEEPVVLPKPAPKLVQPKPEPKPLPPEPPPKPRVLPVRPRPEPAPEPKADPAPKPKPKSAKVAVSEPAQATKPARTAARSVKPATHHPLAPPSVSAADDTPRPFTGKPATAKGAGTDVASTKPRPRGARLGADFLQGLADQPSKPKTAAPAAVAPLNGPALAGIAQAIQRQIQPCADQQHDPGPGANQIVTVLNVQLNRDGTLAATPTMTRQSGVDGDNERYARRVLDLGIAAFKGCTPLRLPADLYAGWSNIAYKWQLKH